MAPFLHDALAQDLHFLANRVARFGGFDFEMLCAPSTGRSCASCL